jgi:hypothetical protein
MPERPCAVCGQAIQCNPDHPADALVVHLFPCAEVRAELTRLREFVREFAAWKTTADLNRLALRARDLID